MVTPSVRGIMLAQRCASPCVGHTHVRVCCACISSRLLSKLLLGSSTMCSTLHVRSTCENTTGFTIHIRVPRCHSSKLAYRSASITGHSATLPRSPSQQAPARRHPQAGPPSRRTATWRAQRSATHMRQRVSDPTTTTLRTNNASARP
jgi:hypothetical protein